MATTETAREKALANYRKKLLEHRELDARLKESMYNLVVCRNFFQVLRFCVNRNSSRVFIVSLLDFIVSFSIDW